MRDESDTAVKDMPRNGLPGLFLTAAVVVSMAVGSISYMNGSGPELIALKSSVSLFVVGIMGCVASALASQSSQPSETATAQEGSPNVDNTEVASPEAVPADAEAISPSPESSVDK